MKRLLFTSVLLLMFLLGNTQESGTIENLEQFIVLYTFGDNWDDNKGAYEQEYFDDHSAHLSTLRTAGTIELGARYEETGMIVIKAKDEAEARSVINADIAIQNKLFHVEIFAFRPFYKGCIE